MARESFKVMGHWFDKAEKYCNEEQFKELCYILIQYGLFENEIKSEDPAVGVTFDFIKDQIDRMQDSYDTKIEVAKSAAGRKSTYTDSENRTIYELAHQGYKVKDIAEEMGITDEKRIKAIYNSPGWKNRKNDNFC